MMADTTTIRISRATHDKLRLAAYKQNRSIMEILEELTKDFEIPKEESLEDKINRALNK